MEPVKATGQPLRISEVTSRLGISDYLVRLYAEKGQLRGFQTPGKQWRFQAEDVEAFAAKIGSKPAPNGRDLESGGPLGDLGLNGRDLSSAGASGEGEVPAEGSSGPESS